MLSRAIDIARAATAAAGLERLDSLISEDGESTLAQLNRAGEELASLRGPWGQGWPELTVDHEIALSGAAQYPLPADVSQILEGTVWWSGDYDALGGPLTPQEIAQINRGQWWQDRTVWWTRNNGVDATISLWPRVSGRLTLTYISENWVALSESQQAAAPRISADGHLPILPARLLELGLEWRIRESAALDFLPTLGVAELERDRAFGQAVGRTRASIGPRRPQAGPGIGGLTIVEPESGGETPPPSEHGPTVYVGWAAAVQPTTAEIRQQWVPRPGLTGHSLPARSSAGHVGIALPLSAGTLSEITLGGFDQLGAFDRRADATVNGQQLQVWTSDNLVDHAVYGGGSSVVSVAI